MIKRILTEGNPDDLKILTTKSEPVTIEEFKNGTAGDIIQDLIDTLKSKGDGLGMAANQIGVLKRIFITQHVNNFSIFINPIFIYGWGAKMKQEGCFSRPGKFEKILRRDKISIKWTTDTGKLKSGQFTGRKGQVIQHELDHFEGVLI